MHEFPHQGAGHCLGKDVTLTVIGSMLTCQPIEEVSKEEGNFQSVPNF